MHPICWPENLNGKEDLEDVGVDNIKMDLKKWAGRVWIRLV
jgi:hypothetical protein